MAFEVQAPREDGGLRFADAMAFNTRKSSGLALHGFELKVSRADFLNELADPSKHLPAAGLVDYWWLVLGDDGILRPEDLIRLPMNWGVMVPDPEKGFAKVRHASCRTKGKDRPDLDRALMAAFYRRLMEDTDASPAVFWAGQLRKAGQAGYRQGFNAGRKHTVNAIAKGVAKDLGLAEPPELDGSGRPVNFCP